MAYDVIVAGGSIAGAAAAAALREFGYDVLIIEPGLDNNKRLAGELIHPPGVAGLAELGLLSSLQNAGAASIHGFAVFAGATTLLSYDRSGQTGLAIEHFKLADLLLQAAERMPHVTVWRGARVTAIDLSRRDRAVIRVLRQGRETQLRTPLLIAADGRGSPTRRMAGIPCRQRHLSNMVGYSVKDARVPFPGCGHVFADGPAPALAYEIGGRMTRIMFDVPAGGNGNLDSRLDALPQPFRSDVEQAIAEQTPLHSANYAIVPEMVVKGRLVCVGDAGGCCHPLSATGLSACTRDALLLQKALRKSSSKLSAAVHHYAAMRREPQRTRLSGAEVLYEVFRGGSSEMRLLRQGLIRYWKKSERGRAATMSLLSTEEIRTSVLMREYVQVYRYALAEWIRCTEAPTVLGLSRALVRFVLSAAGK